MNTLLRLTAILLGLIFVSAACQERKADKSEDIAKSQDLFMRGSVSEAGLSETIIKEIADSVAAGYYPNRHSLLIYKSGKLVFEQYYPGKDERWGDTLGMVTFTDKTLHDVRSISKSVVSACFGIALAQGKIKDINQSVFDYFPEYTKYRVGQKANLKIYHLLTMTGGFEWDESAPGPENSEWQMESSPDRIDFILSRPQEVEPGTRWQYCSGTTELLAQIILRTTGKNVHEFAIQHIFNPIGIEHSEWTLYTDTDLPASASGLRLTPRDMLRFGLLYMNGGSWNGQQIVPGDWVEASLKTSILREENSGYHYAQYPAGYGFQFWTWDQPVQGEPIHIAMANGNGDQKIYIDKAHELIVVTTAGNYYRPGINKNSLGLLNRIFNAMSGS